MIMNKLINIFSIAILATAMVSCNLLDVDNPSHIYGNNYWKNPSEVESYLTGTYTSFRSACNSLEYFEARSDEFIGGLEGSGSNQWAQNLTALNGISWGRYYTPIQHCNMILKNIDKASFVDKSRKNEILAQTYTIRAYMYFCLTRLWGRVPLELEPTEGSDKPLLARSSCDEVVAQILKDLETAFELYSSDEWPDGKSCASKRGAYALAADVYLWKAKVLGGTDQDYENVIKYADLASVGSELEETYEDIFDVNNRNGKEIIWSIHFGYPEISGNYTHFLTLRDQFVKTAVNMEDIPYAISGARNSYQPSPEIREIFNEFPGDARLKSAYIEAVDQNGTVLGVSQNKFVGTKTETNRIFDDDIILYRLSEMILFKAEAYAAMGNVDLAVSELNKVRARAKIGEYDGAKDKISVEKALLNERGREFWLENKRWPDLLRFHYEGVIDVYSVVPKLKERKDVDIIVPLYFAIPVSELSLNHNLDQTEGY